MTADDYPPALASASVDQLAGRVAELDSWALANDNPDVTDEERDGIFSAVFPTGFDPERDWDDYHLVRSEYDRRAAEEFDLGQ